MIHIYMTEQLQVVLVCGRTDLRKGMDGLAALVKLHYGMDPVELEGTLFLFCGRNDNEIQSV